MTTVDRIPKSQLASFYGAGVGHKFVMAKRDEVEDYITPVNAEVIAIDFDGDDALVEIRVYD